MFTLIAWLLFQIMPSASLGLKYIFAEVIDIQTIDDGKGDKRNIVVRYEGKQMILISWMKYRVFCVKEWQGTSMPKGPTPRYPVLALPSDCVATNATE